MSFKVVNEVLEHSRAAGVDRCVMLAIAEAAHHDGVSWIPQGPPGDDPADRRNIAARANCSVREVKRSIAACRDLGELEVRKAQKGRARVNVYRVVVGVIGRQDVDYNRLPFTLNEPFGRGDDLAPRDATAAADEAASAIADTTAGRGDDLAPRPGADEVTNPVATRGHLTRAGEGTALEPSKTRESSDEASLVPAPDGAGEEETDLEQLRWALTAQLGCKPKTRSEHGSWERALRELADAGATGQDVTARSAVFRELWPAAQLTPFALTRWWSLLGARLDGASPAASARAWVERTSWQLDRDDAHAVLDTGWRELPDGDRAELHTLIDTVADRQKAVA